MVPRLNRPHLVHPVLQHLRPVAHGTKVCVGAVDECCATVAHPPSHCVRADGLVAVEQLQRCGTEGVPGVEKWRYLTILCAGAPASKRSSRPSKPTASQPRFRRDADSGVNTPAASSCASAS